MVFEINRVIKKEGKLFLSSPNIASWRAIINVINGIYPMEHMKYHPHLGFPQHIREYMPWEIAQFLEEAGFQIEKIRTYEVTSRKLNFWEHMLSWCLSLIIIFSSRHPKFLFLRAPKIFVMAKKYTEPAHNAGAFLYI